MTTYAQGEGIADIARDPILTIACVLLIVVSIGWIVVVRLIARRLKRAALRRAVPREAVRPARDIWSLPP